MPKMTGTGPQGKGPKTGRKLGLGTDYNEDELYKIYIKIECEVRFTLNILERI